MKKKLLVSVSGGETSMYMAWWLWTYKQNEFDMIFVFANTGQENFETLSFVEWFSYYYKIPIVWVEAVPRFIKVQDGENVKRGIIYNVIDYIGSAWHGLFNDHKIGTTFKVVDYNSANVDGKPFEAVIAKYGIPNISTPHCTRELKAAPIKAYAKSIGWYDYETAIGIRTDELKRRNKKAVKMRLLYPLLDMRPMDKKKINFWWSQQPQRLNLKGYQGNCVTCWKKSDNKLYQIAKENERAFVWMQTMELKYGKFIPETRLRLMEERGEYPTLPVRFFRKNRSVEDIIREAKLFDGNIIDDSQELDESCEVFTECNTPLQ